jgi:hypothetical protein
MERRLSGRPAPTTVDCDGGDSPAWTRKREPYVATVRRREGAVPFAELHAHSHFSFLDGASSPQELVETAAELGLQPLALTDHDGLYGIVRFAEAAAEIGLPTVFGAELSLGLSGLQNGAADPGAGICWCWPGTVWGMPACLGCCRRRTGPAVRRVARCTTRRAEHQPGWNLTTALVSMQASGVRSYRASTLRAANSSAGRGIRDVD